MVELTLGDAHTWLFPTVWHYLIGVGSDVLFDHVHLVLLQSMVDFVYLTGFLLPGENKEKRKPNLKNQLEQTCR